MGTKMLSFILIFAIAIFPSFVDGNSFTIFWEPTNNRFLTSYPQINVNFNDRITIACPQKYSQLEYTYAKIYMVSEDDYNKCSTRNSTKLLAVCDDYTTRLSSSFVIRDMTPIPNGLEFSSNTMYYIISSSTGTYDGINRKKGGICNRKNMKIKMRVGPRNMVRKVPKPVRFRHEEEEDYSLMNYPPLFAVHEYRHNGNEGIRGVSACSSLIILVLLYLGF